MAEVVQSHIEEMLPEVYELQQLGVLSSAEGKSVIKTRTDFEYKMRRRISKKQDFLRFIDFELKLEKLKQSRILQLGLNDVSEGARYRSLQRIHFIFQKCLRKYKSDVPLWIRYIQYCKQVSSTRSLGLAFVEALKHNPNCVKLWIMSSKNEMEVNKNVSAARSIFLQALKFNSDSAELWTEYFRLEVLHVEKLQKRRQIMDACDKPSALAATDDFMNFKTARIVFKNALSCINLTSQTLSGFSDVVGKLEFNGEELMKFLFEAALKQSPDNSSLWVCLAEFVVTKDVAKAQSILQTAYTTIQTFECLKDIILFMITFTEKLGDIQPMMMEFMTRSLDELSIGNPDTVIFLGDKMIANNLADFLPRIYEVALKRYPKNKSLWLYKILNLSDDPSKDLEDALSALPDDPDILSEYLTSLSFTDPAKCRAKWDEVVKESFASPLLSQYLQYVCTSSGLENARKVFKDLQNLHTVPEHAVVAMLNYEMVDGTNTEQVCRSFNLLTTHFNTTENWKMYLEFCQKNCPEQISSVLWKCRNSLSEEQVAILL